MATKLGSLTLDLICRTGNFTQGMRQASTTAEREMGRIERSTNNAANSIKNMAAIAVGAFSISQLTNYADSYTEIVNKLKLVTAGQSELNTAIGDTHKIAQTTASEWSAVNDVYSKYMSNAKALNLTQKEVARLTEITSKAVAISGSNSQAAAGALFQYGQSLDGNILRAEEYNSLVDGAGGLLNAMAKGLNTTRGGLRQMMLDGKLTGEVITKALMKAGESVDDLYSKTNTTTAASFNLIKNESIRMVGEFDAATGASTKFVQGMKYLSENMSNVTNIMMVGVAYMAGSYIPAIYKSVVATKTKIASILEEIQVENASIAQSQRKAQAEFNAAQAQSTRARDAVLAAEMQVAANRSVLASEIQRMQATLAATNVEKAQEAQRLRSQITDIGRTQAITRMAELQKLQAIQVAELATLESRLASTTIASSSIYEAARNKQTAATARLTAATSGLNAANALTTRSSIGLMGALGGPVGLGIMVASIAAGFLLMRDSSKEVQSALDDQGLTVDELKKKYQEMNAEAVKLKALDAAEVIKKQNIDIRSSFSALQQVIDGFVDTSRIQEAKGLTEYLDDLKAGGDRASKAFSILESKKILTDSQLRTVANLGQQVNDSRASIEKQNTILDIAKNKHLDHAKAAKTGAEGVGKVGIEAVSAAAKVKNLGEEVQKFINDSLNSTTDNLRKYQLISQGYTTATADMILAAEKAEGVNGTGGPLSVLSSSVLATQILSQKKLTDLVDERTEAEKKVNDELKKRKELLEKTINSKTIDSVIGRGEGGYNSVNLGQKYGYKSGTRNLTDMTVSQVLSAQNKKEFNTAGKYQLLSSTLKGALDAGIVSTAEKFNREVQERILQQYLLTAKKDRGAIEDYIRGKNDNIIAANIDAAKEFASIASPVTGRSHYDGKANNKARISVKEAQNALKASRELYTQAIASGKSAEEAWKAAFSGSISFIEGSDAQKGLDQLATYKEKLAEDRTALIEHYNLWQKLENDNAKQVKDIQEKFANDPVVRDRLLALQSKAYQEDVENYIKAGDDRVKADYQATQEIIAARQTAFDNINNPIYSMRDKGVEAIAQSSLSPLAFQKWDLNRQQQDGYSQLGDDLNTASMAINDSDVLSEQEKKDKLLQIEQEYQDAKLALAQTYDQQHRDLENQTQAASLAGYGAMFGMMGSMFDAYGDKESTGYKVAFAMQKAFVLSSAILNAKGAVMAAWNDPANTTIWQKMAAAAATVVQTNDLMSAIQGVALTGMAHDGIANVPEEGTWLLSKGERVLNPQDNKAFTNMINNGGGGNKVIINNYGSDKVETSQDADGNLMVTIGKMIDGAVDRGIQRNLKQGYPLSNAIRGK
ncbi:tape measure protein [Acinetobacter guillouiae]|uniref:tape measure protein n=1 Tax=Acinetobacter guillouiae TaxID=106649 RepID=UPI002FDA8E7A